MEAIRKTAVAGTFYPDHCDRIIEAISGFNTLPKTKEILKKFEDIRPRAVIVPHAGYIYSGMTANLAYRMLQSEKGKRFIVIGPSHKYAFSGISGSFFEAFQTPCGNLEVDTPYLFALAQRFNIGFIPKAHEKEHSTEVQMPFIQYYFPNSKIIELVYSYMSEKRLANIISALLKNPENILIISSDLSHFYPLEKAKRIDRHCIKGIETLSLSELQQCEACGDIGIQAMTIAAKHLGLTPKVLYYTTSAQTSKDTTSVVGYLSALYY